MSTKSKPFSVDLTAPLSFRGAAGAGPKQLGRVVGSSSSESEPYPLTNPFIFVKKQDFQNYFAIQLGLSAVAEGKLADVYVFSQQTEIKSKRYDDYFFFELI